MAGATWYYCDAERDDQTAHGPISLDKLCELIRAGALPDDVLVSRNITPGPSWVEADTVEEILRALPLARERLIREYIAYGEAPPGAENWGSASDRMYSLLENLPEFAWELVVEMIERAPSDDALGFIAASPFEDLLSQHGALFIARVEQRALVSMPFRRALGMVRRLGMTDDVWRRVQNAALEADGRTSP